MSDGNRRFGQSAAAIAAALLAKRVQKATLYQALQKFDDRAAQARITCPRLCFVGSVDEIQYGKSWGM